MILQLGLFRLSVFVGVSLISLVMTSFAQETKAMNRYEEVASRHCAASGARNVDFSDRSQRTYFFADATKCISKGSAGSSSSQLEEDQKVVGRMYPEIRKFYSEHGYSSSKDAAQITVLGWARYRSENTSGPLSERVLVKLSQSFGRLTVKSHPPGAAVEVDGMLWDGTTEVTDWTTADKHPVKLTKEGCGPEKGEVVVPAAGDVTFEMTLKCKK